MNLRMRTNVERLDVVEQGGRMFSKDYFLLHCNILLLDRLLRIIRHTLVTRLRQQARTPPVSRAHKEKKVEICFKFEDLCPFRPSKQHSCLRLTPAQAVHVSITLACKLHMCCMHVSITPTCEVRAPRGGIRSASGSPTGRLLREVPVARAVTAQTSPWLHVYSLLKTSSWTCPGPCE